MSEDPIVALKGHVEALEGWRAQMLALQEAADKKLRPLVEHLPGALGRHVYEVAAEEIERLRPLADAAVGLCEACEGDRAWLADAANREGWPLVEVACTRLSNAVRDYRSVIRSRSQRDREAEKYGDWLPVADQEGAAIKSLPADR